MYRIDVDELEEGGNASWTADIFFNERRIGWVEARRYDDQAFTVADIEHAYLEPRFQGQGIAFAAYEVLYAHLKTRGIKTITGGAHSSGAARVHQKLALKYGYQYPYAHQDASKGFPYDKRFGPYRYALK